MKQNDNNKALKFILRLIKKVWANILDIRSILKSNQKFLLFTSIIIPIIIKFYYGLPKIFFIFVFQYFFWKALFQIIKEDAISLKYKGLSKLFDDKVKELKDMFEKQNLQSLQSLKFQIKPSKITLEDGEESKTPKVVGE